MIAKVSQAPTEVSAQTNQQLLHTIGVNPQSASPTELMQAVAQVARAQLSERWVATQVQEHNQKARRVVYLSMEFLMGRTLSNALAALDLTQGAALGLAQHAQRLEDVAEREADAALGNGGLGRLAACFLDSMATLGLPSWGYGIRYEYGMFAQHIGGGQQLEYPDPWLVNGTPWEFPRADISYPVRFGGWVEHLDGRALWHNCLLYTSLVKLELMTKLRHRSPQLCHELQLCQPDHRPDRAVHQTQGVQGRQGLRVAQVA